jgi:hypothetical protein
MDDNDNDDDDDENNDTNDDNNDMKIMTLIIIMSIIVLIILISIIIPIILIIYTTNIYIIIINTTTTNNDHNNNDHIILNLYYDIYFQDNLEYHYVPVSQETFVGYDQTITNGIGSASLNWCYPMFVLYIIIFLFDLFLYDHISNTTSDFSYTHILNVLSFCRSTF